MENKSLEQHLNEKREETWKSLKNERLKIKEYINKNSLTNLPKGITADVYVRNSFGYRDGREFELSLMFFDKNYKEGEKYAKYFWTDIGRVDVEFSVGDDYKINTKYKTNFGSGGYNKNEYGNGELSEIDPITIQEKIIKIRQATVEFLKEVRDKPQVLSDYAIKVINAENFHSKVSNEYEEEVKKRKTVEKEAKLEKINSKIKAPNEEEIEDIIQELNTDSPYVQSRQIIVSKINSDHLSFELVNIECNKGKRTTYRADYSVSDNSGAVKKADLPSLLSKSVSLNGKVISSIDELIDNLNDSEIKNQFEKQGFRSKGKIINIKIDNLINAISNKEDICQFLSSKKDTNKNTHKKGLSHK